MGVIFAKVQIEIAAAVGVDGTEVDADCGGSGSGSGSSKLLQRSDCRRISMHCYYCCYCCGSYPGHSFECPRHRLAAGHIDREVRSVRATVAEAAELSRQEEEEDEEEDDDGCTRKRQKRVFGMM